MSSEATGSKGKRKAVDKSTRKKKTSVEVTSTQATGLDASLETYYDLEEKGRSAFLGYARMDILKRDFKFGLYNPRPLNHVEMRNILDSFNNNGLDRFSIRSAIPIIIPAEMVDLATVKKDIAMDSIDRHGSHLPLLSVTWDDDEQEHGIIAAGGRHRRAALAEWIKQKESQTRKAKSMWQSLKNRKDDPVPLQDEVAEAKVKYEVNQAMLNLHGMWIVAVYDLCEFCSARHELHLTHDVTHSESRHETWCPFVDEPTFVQLRGDG